VPVRMRAQTGSDIWLLSAHVRHQLYQADTISRGRLLLGTRYVLDNPKMARP